MYGILHPIFYFFYNKKYTIKILIFYKLSFFTEKKNKFIFSKIYIKKITFSELQSFQIKSINFSTLMHWLTT